MSTNAPVALSLIQPAAPSASRIDGATYERLARRVKRLSWFSLGYMALLAGLLANAAFGAWWLDPVIGLAIAAVAVKEGCEAWRGDDCSTR